LPIADRRLPIHGLPIDDCGFPLTIGDWDCRLAIVDWELAIGTASAAEGDCCRLCRAPISNLQCQSKITNRQCQSAITNRQSIRQSSMPISNPQSAIR
jgi:hypothetical protein